MPRSRGPEMPQRQSPRGPHPLRTSSSDSDPLHNRPIARSPKVGERRSLRGGPQSDSLNQKKLGTRIAGLESQLEQAQTELKILKEQLASAEAAKKEAQEKLENKTEKQTVPDPTEFHGKHPPTEIQDSNESDFHGKHPPTEIQDSYKSDSNSRDEVPDDSQQETDVFEVPVEKAAIEPEIDRGQSTDEVEKETKAINISSVQPPEIMEPEKPSFHDLASKDDEINMVRAKLGEKEKELEVFGQENESLRNQLNDATSNILSAQAKEEEKTLMLSQVGQELEVSKANAAQLKEKLEAVEGAKSELEAEMKKLRVQTEQWRKAADAAATVLAGGVEMNGRIADRCCSMDKQFGGVFEPHSGYIGFVGSPVVAEGLDDGFGIGKRKGSGIKKFGDLWKKKGQK
ncbi:hypothetical protein CFOL_v3_04408 [Cephalotus follicularis]|uniref:Interactor of constitutive active ROPs n=1 Tax=Cephalotus follicularis TaxID=3775 RepID=A0A1Q3AYT1_CEPFO|nr:hypothetical protein CFOL_v3_04408 [Cephalotus follicularis]